MVTFLNADRRKNWRYKHYISAFQFRYIHAPILTCTMSNCQFVHNNKNYKITQCLPLFQHCFCLAESLPNACICFTFLRCTKLFFVKIKINHAHEQCTQHVYISSIWNGQNLLWTTENIEDTCTVKSFWYNQIQK